MRENTHISSIVPRLSRFPATPIHSASVFLIMAVAAVALTGCGKGKSSVGARADASGSEVAAAAQIVSNKLAAIAATGDPVTLEELQKWYPEPPGGRNAAVFYGHAFNALTPAKDTNDAKSPSYLARNQKALALLLQAAEYKDCRYPLDFTEGAAMKLPHVSKAKSAGFLLQSEAVSQAARGHTDAATKALLAEMALARSLQNEPITISWLVECACLSSAVEGLEQAFSRRAFTEEQLLSLQGALRQAQSAASCGRALVGERAFAISEYQMPAEALTNVFQIGPAEVPQILAYKKTVTFQQDFEFTLDYFSNALAVAAMPFPQGLEPEAQQAIPSMETAKAKGYKLASLFAPALGNLTTRAGEAAARIRTAQAGLAVERYRLKHANALPDSLAELTPECVDTVPADPFDGQPLRYKKLLGKGYVIYSIGKDRKDDGGTAKAPDGKQQLDITFTVER
jgi:hypothetical protein